MNEKQPILSIIVPVFRVEKYLDTCVMSLLHQDLNAEEYEIILVDDGSDDACPQKCDDYATQHKQIHVIHQPNKGVSASRNAGVAIAKGEYIAFVDADDYLDACAYSKLVKNADHNQLDILKFSYTIRREDGTIIKSNYSKNDIPIVDGEYFLNNYTTESCFCWTYLFRKKIITDSGTYFFSELFYEEDTDWLPRIMLQAQRVGQTSICCYNYMLHSGSATHPYNSERWKKMLTNNVIVLTRLQETATPANNKKWFESMSASIVASMLTVIAKHFYTEKNTYISDMHSIYPHKLHCSKPFSISERIKALIINISPQLYCFLRRYL